ncbi:MAG: tetratricopeptide repeat protein, partial [Planctomycetota bacterium]
ATRENLDQCEGDFFAARLAAAKEQYNEALTRLDEALKQRPVFSQAYMLRSSVNAALGNEQASIADIQKAASLNPFDGNIAKQLAMTLFRYNKKLGDDALSEQTIEIRNALDRALLMNPADLDLLSFYAEYISSTEPFRALAIRQNLHRVSPGMSNALLLGRLATKLAVDDTDASRKEALFNIAKSAFEQADRIDPQDKQMLLNYADYYRARGQEQLAKQLLIESEDKKLLWEHYFRSGKYSDAQSVLEQLYQADAKDPDVLRGFILVADKTTDAEAVKKYSQELLQVDESIDNYLIQIQAFLKVGLIKEVEHKLASFREKHPDESRAFLLEAWLAMKQGQLEKALQMTNRHLEVDQDSMDGWRLRGEINFYLTNYNQAILDLKKSKSLTDDPVTRVALARAYLRANRDEDAITELRSTINLDEAPMQARILLEEIYTRLDREQELKKLYDETLDEFPDDIGWYNRAAKFAMLKNELERAEKLFAQAWEKSKLGGNGSLAAFDGYLGALMFTGKYDKLFELAGKNVDGELASIAFLKMAQAKVKLDEKDVAAKYFRKAVEKTGTNQILAADILQEMLEQLGQQEVLEYCNQRLAENPNSLVANLTMFTLKRIAGEYNKAIDYIDNCLKIVGPDSIYAANYMAKKAMVLQAVYNKTADKKYLNSAITLYESLLEKMPNNSNVLNNLAYMMAEADIRLEKALEYAERAYKATPNNANFMDTYSYALYKNQQYEKAAEFLQAAMQIYERNKISAEPVVYEHLGQIYEKLGEQNKAIVAYKQALEADKDNLSEIVRNRITEAIQRLSK